MKAGNGGKMLPTIAFKYILILIWIVCGLVDLIKGPTKHKTVDEDGNEVESVDYALQIALVITLLWGFAKLFIPKGG